MGRQHILGRGERVVGGRWINRGWMGRHVAWFRVQEGCQWVKVVGGCGWHGAAIVVGQCGCGGWQGGSVQYMGTTFHI